MTKEEATKALQGIKRLIAAGAIGTTLVGTTTTLSSCTPKTADSGESITDEEIEEQKRNEETDERNRQDAEKEAAYQATNTTTSEISVIGDNIGTKTTTVENTTNEEKPIQTSANTNTGTPSKTTTANGESYTPTTTQVQVTVTTKAPETTKATTTTTQKVTEPPVTTTTTPIKQNYTKYDLLDSDPTIATRAYEELTKQFKNDLYNGYIIDGVYGDTDGYYECKAMLAMLNHDQGIAPEVLSNVFEDYSEEEFYTYTDTLAFASIEKLTKGKVDFTKYVLDEDLAEFINETNQAWKDYRLRDNTNFDTIVKTYGKDNNLNDTDNIDDYLKFYYIVIAGETLDRRMGYEAMTIGKELYEDNIVKPIYDSYKEYTYVNK